MMGATEVLGLTCSVIIEEGFPRADLERILASMRAACREAGAAVVTGDTKVMGKRRDRRHRHQHHRRRADRARGRDAGLPPGDRIIVTGTLGDHGMAVMAARHGLALDGDAASPTSRR